jgi:hypothetical protein
MGYSGYQVHLCQNGHMWKVDEGRLYQAPLSVHKKSMVCSVCGKPSKQWCPVHTTNGVGPEHGPESMMPRLRMMCYDDVWHVDHYGTRYATRVPRYRLPNATKSNRWRLI